MAEWRIVTLSEEKREVAKGGGSPEQAVDVIWAWGIGLKMSKPLEDLQG